MPTQAKWLLSGAGLSLLIATIAGAVGSHALTFQDAQALNSFETAVQFQFFHGFGVIAAVLVGLAGLGGALRAGAAWLMLGGTVPLLRQHLRARLRRLARGRRQRHRTAASC